TPKFQIPSRSPLLLALQPDTRPPLGPALAVGRLDRIAEHGADLAF
uniref:Uncharacterized protein n=1 Tax=Caenorhabditis japonica TaxID=281687 RepID=A0A8R1ESC8_CAEJA